MKRTFLTLVAGVVVGLGAPPAHATNGYFAHGYGTHYKGIAGAGAALHLDALAPATNPAAIAFLGNRFDVGVALFNPNRFYTVSGDPSGFPGTFGLVPGEVESQSRYFPIPHLGANWMVGETSAFGVSIYGNGGMNTDWPTATFYASSPTGVDMSQLFVAPTYAVRLGGKHALGLSVIAAYQRFEAKGIGSFAPFSSDPAHLSNSDHDNSFGGGFRIGYLGEWSERFSVGGSYQTKVWMSEFDDYAGLFAEQGDFDIPSNWVVGIAIKPTDKLTFAFDVQQVRYSEITSVGSPLLPNLMQAPLGADTGAGFGWEDMTTFKGGVELRTDGGWAWRAGYSHGEQPIPATEVLFNILAPGVQEQHLTFGFSKALGASREISFALMRSFTEAVEGANPLEVPGLQTIELEMNQWEFELSFSFGIKR